MTKLNKEGKKVDNTYKPDEGQMVPTTFPVVSDEKCGDCDLYVEEETASPLGNWPGYCKHKNHKIARNPDSDGCKDFKVKE